MPATPRLLELYGNHRAHTRAGRGVTPRECPETAQNAAILTARNAHNRPKTDIAVTATCR